MQMQTVEVVPPSKPNNTSVPPSETGMSSSKSQISPFLHLFIAVASRANTCSFSSLFSFSCSGIMKPQYLKSQERERESKGERQRKDKGQGQGEENKEEKRWIKKFEFLMMGLGWGCCAVPLKYAPNWTATPLSLSPPFLVLSLEFDIFSFTLLQNQTRRKREGERKLIFLQLKQTRREKKRKTYAVNRCGKETESDSWQC